MTAEKVSPLPDVKFYNNFTSVVFVVSVNTFKHKLDNGLKDTAI